VLRLALEWQYCKVELQIALTPRAGCPAHAALPIAVTRQRAGAVIGAPHMADRHIVTAKHLVTSRVYMPP